MYFSWGGFFFQNCRDKYNVQVFGNAWDTIKIVCVFADNGNEPNSEHSGATVFERQQCRAIKAEINQVNVPFNEQTPKKLLMPEKFHQKFWKFSNSVLEFSFSNVNIF